MENVLEALKLRGLADKVHLEWVSASGGQVPQDGYPGLSSGSGRSDPGPLRDAVK